MKVSIVIPVYNVEKYLEECVKSVREQTYSDIEIIFIDDGSTDSSGIICDNLAKEDSRIVVIHTENKGLSAARNKGISVASGDYVAFLDSDDFWLCKNGVEKAVEAIKISDCDVLFWGYKKVYGYTFTQISAENIQSEIFEADGSLKPKIKERKLISCAWNSLIRKNAFEETDLSFEEGRFSEDVEWLTRLLIYANKVCFADFEMTAYRQREASITHSVTKKNVDDMLHHCDTVVSHIEKTNGGKKELLKAYLSEQVCNAVISVSMLKKGEYPIETVKKYKKYMSNAVTSRSKLIALFSKIFGFKATVGMLRITGKVI